MLKSDPGEEPMIQQQEAKISTLETEDPLAAARCLSYVLRATVGLMVLLLLAYFCHAFRLGGL